MKLLIFAGTTEGRILCERLKGNHQITACVATQYGETLLPSGVKVLEGRLDETGMKALMHEGAFDAVIDATHPYAVEVTRNIRAACEALTIPYERLAREMDAYQGCTLAGSAEEAAQTLLSTQGNILLTIGAKTVSAFAGLAHRVIARVLPMPDSLIACASAGIPPSQVVAMQGPFSEELNMALMRQFDVRHLVTKDSGMAGGLPEKLAAARALGVHVIMIRRPEDWGVSLPHLLRRLMEGEV